MNTGALVILCLLLWAGFAWFILIITRSKLNGIGSGFLLAIAITAMAGPVRDYVKARKEEKAATAAGIVFTDNGVLSRQNTEDSRPAQDQSTGNGEEPAQSDSPLQADSPPQAEKKQRKTITKRLFIAESRYGDKWPFTVAQGELECRKGAVLMLTGQGIYSINETAVTRYRKKFPEWREIAKPYPGSESDSQAKMPPPEDLIKRGLDLCE